MVLNYDKIYSSKDEIKDLKRDNAFEVVGLVIHAISNYDPNNDYTPSIPLTIEVKENPYSYDNEGYARLFVKSGGADSERPITVRKTKEGNYMLWSDTIMGLLSDIREPESNNPWA